MGPDTINLLIVEDRPDDATLLVVELKRKGLPVRHCRVDTREDFLAALQRQIWDAVIADYILPNFSGPEALYLLRYQAPGQGEDTPFIMVSGIYGEEEAVRMMKAGANDYLMKSSLHRLAPTLERELAAAQDRRARQRAEGATQFLAAIVESSSDAIYGKNLDGLIASWNPAAERLFGYGSDEMVGRSNALLFPENRRDEMLEIMAAVRRGERVGERETERLHKDGSVIPVSVTISPIINSAGEIIGASSIARDISRQKKAELEREQLRERFQAVAKEAQTLAELLPICASCKRVRDDEGYWQQVEAYMAQRSHLTFSHGICPACADASHLLTPKINDLRKY
jgi:PAS domain S-box-containing protein